jgi:predicted secreted Zn-dependent protease
MRLTKAFRLLILFNTLTSLLMTNQVSGQNFITKGINQIDLSFFQGSAPKNSPYASMTFIDYDYQFVVESNSRTDEVKVDVTVNITPNSAKSYLDVSRVHKNDIDRLVNHEQGHIIIGFIIGKKVEDELNACRYTRNYKEEIRINYQKFYATYEKIQLEYDRQTRHGANLEVQKRWNKKLRVYLDKFAKNISL